MADVTLARERATRARYTTRISFFEEPRIAESLERLAAASGRSVASEIRGAIRYWLEANGWEEHGGG